MLMRQVDRLAVGEHGLDGFEVEIGEMDYGFEFGGIIGMDFLRAARAVIDLGNLQSISADPSAPTERRRS